MLLEIAVNELWCEALNCWCYYLSTAHGEAHFVWHCKVRISDAGGSSSFWVNQDSFIWYYHVQVMEPYEFGSENLEATAVKLMQKLVLRILGYDPGGSTFLSITYHC